MESPEALDVSKENIQPLRQGRNASQLTAALQAQTDATILQNLVKKRQEYELLLRTYNGNDPLGIWFEYVEWVEQSFPKDGNEGNIMTLLQNCLSRFKDSVEYFQDIRLVKLWIKYLERLENPLEFYNQLNCHGIGSQCAHFYKCWAYELFENDDFKQADKVLQAGIRRNAQPLDELKRAHAKFQIAVARRVLDKSLLAPEENAVVEERKVGSVLTTFGKKHKVPSVRIGGRVKSSGPGTLHSRENVIPQRSMESLNIYETENDPGMARSANKMQTVPHLDILKKENTKKPTPWSGIKQKSAYQFHPPKPSFQVLGDENAQPEPLNNLMFLNALRPKKKDDGFYCPVAVFEVPNPNNRPMYPKDQVYAGGTEYSIEELKAVNYMKRKERKNKEHLVSVSGDAVEKEVTVCTLSNSTKLENFNPLTVCATENSSGSTLKKEIDSCSYTENVIHHEQQIKKEDKEDLVSVSRDAVEKEVTVCTLSNSTKLENFNLLTVCATENSSGSTLKKEIDSRSYTENVIHHEQQIKKENNLCSYTENRFHGEQQMGALDKDYEKHFQIDSSSAVRNDWSFRDRKIIKQPSMPNSQYQHLMVGHKYTDSSTNHLVEIDNVCVSGSCVVPPVVKQCDLDGNFVPKNFTQTDSFATSSLNKEGMTCSENADTIVSSNKQSSSRLALALVENEQQKNREGLFLPKGSGFSVFTADNDIGAPEAVKSEISPVSINREEIPDSENANVMLSSNKHSSCKPVLLVTENLQENQNNQAKFLAKDSAFSVFTVDDGIGAPETVKSLVSPASINREEIADSENADVMASFNKQSSCNPALLVAENAQENQNNQGKFFVKGSGFSVFTADDDIGAPETVKSVVSPAAFKSEEIPNSGNANIMLSSHKQSSCMPALLVAKNEQQEHINQGKFSAKEIGFSVFSAEDTGATETFEACRTSNYMGKGDIVPHSNLADNVLSSIKIEGVSSPILLQGNEKKQNGNFVPKNVTHTDSFAASSLNKELSVFNDEANCYAKGQVEVNPEPENRISGLPHKNRNLFSHSVLCDPNKQLHDNVRSFSSTSKKTKVVAPFQLFVDDGEAAMSNEPRASKRELFQDGACKQSNKLCDTDSKENMALLSTRMPTNRPVMEKKEAKVGGDIVTANMLKLKRKTATEQIKGPSTETFEQVTSAKPAPKKSEGCAPFSVSASSEELLKVIYECWASPPKSKEPASPKEVLEVINECWATPPDSKEPAGNGLSPVLHNHPEDQGFQHNPPLALIEFKEETNLFPENKENALPQCTKTKENVVEPADSHLIDDWIREQLEEPRELDDTCCTLMFSKTLISSTPNRKSVDPPNSDSSDNSPPDSQEFKIPRRCPPLQAERFPNMPRPDVLSVIMESSKENKSQSSSGSSSGGRAIHHTAFSLVSPQTENTHSALDLQPYAVKTGTSLPPHDGGNSSI